MRFDDSSGGAASVSRCKRGEPALTNCWFEEYLIARIRPDYLYHMGTLVNAKRILNTFRCLPVLVVRGSEDLLCPRVGWAGEGWAVTESRLIVVQRQGMQ